MMPLPICTHHVLLEGRFLSLVCSAMSGAHTHLMDEQILFCLANVKPNWDGVSQPNWDGEIVPASL